MESLNRFSNSPAATTQSRSCHEQPTVVLQPLLSPTSLQRSAIPPIAYVAVPPPSSHLPIIRPTTQLVSCEEMPLGVEGDSRVLIQVDLRLNEKKVVDEEVRAIEVDKIVEDEGHHDSSKAAALNFDGCLAKIYVKGVNADTWSPGSPSIPEKLHNLYKDELHDACEGTINGLKDMSIYSRMGVKRMGELDNKPFHVTIMRKFVEEVYIEYTIVAVFFSFIVWSFMFEASKRLITSNGKSLGISGRSFLRIFFAMLAVAKGLFDALQWYALVTGGNKGIGLEVCKQLASKGIKVILTSRDEKRGRLEALQSLNHSDHVDFLQLDVVDSASIAAAAQFVTTKYGKLDILVNNAGILGAGLDNVSMLQIEETYEDAEECMQTNLYGVKRVTEALIPLLQLSASPTIVNVSSVTSAQKLFSKAALNAYTKVLAKKHTDFIINSLCHGFARTDLTGNLATISAEEAAQKVVRVALLPRGGCMVLLLDG
ncbi:hypothetical protein SASPL_137428 [Salvia splendens]|uniref:Uncharacterized protein n=1 Tax=Salvia splendens TaxID=180675 RepID=A0A8X8ZCX7_SALSN|nr:hypothetical protein SASPL_137428 [Salvia splendens]